MYECVFARAYICVCTTHTHTHTCMYDMYITCIIFAVFSDNIYHARVCVSKGLGGPRWIQVNEIELEKMYEETIDK